MNNYDYLMNFKSIILMFDGDAAGQEAALECAEALPIGMARIANLGPYKDASEALVAGETRAIIDAIFQAREYRPDGIISTSDLRDTIGEQEALSPITYPYSRLNDITKGLRAGSLITIAAGSGVGKSTFVREIAYHVHQSGFQIGMLMLEESVKRTAQGLVGLHMNKNITVDPDCTTREDIEASFDDLVKDRQFYLFDHFGSTDIDVILNRIRYMNKALGAEVIILDHISILVSGLTGQVNDERRLIDDIMNRLRVLVQELNICLIVVSHLRRPQGDTGHEGGAKVTLSQLRGSHAIAQLADCCIGIQVNAEDPSAGIRDLVVLKNRFTGEVGPAGELQYSQETGRLRESTGNFDSLGTSDIPF
jgi:twinkle protein